MTTALIIPLSLYNSQFAFQSTNWFNNKVLLEHKPDCLVPWAGLNSKKILAFLQVFQIDL